jgi:hypothetical protein
VLMIENRHIDGHDYMWALSELLENAQEAILILVRCVTQYSPSNLTAHAQLRIGGLLLNFTSVALLHTSPNGGWIEFSSAKRNRV